MAAFGKVKPAGVRAATRHANDNKASRRVTGSKAPRGAADLNRSNRRGSGGSGKAMHVYAMGHNFTVAGLSGSTRGLTATFGKPTLKFPANPQVAIARKQVERRMAGLNKARGNNNIPALRRDYIREVQALAGKGNAMRKAGKSPEQIARALHAERRQIGERYKARSTPKELERIHQRNLEKYQDKLGPTVEWYRAQGRSWDEISETASTPGGTDLYW